MNNLQSLYLNIGSYKLNPSPKDEINEDLIQNINNFNSLKQIALVGFKFKKSFILNIPTLKDMKLLLCNNIGLNDKMCLNLKRISISCCTFVQHNYILKFPEVEICEFETWSIIVTNAKKYDYMMDLKSFKKVKRFIGDSYYYKKIKKYNKNNIINLLNKE